MMMQMLDYCGLLIDGVVPGIDEGFYVCHATFVKKADELDGFLEDLGVLALLKQDLLALQLIELCLEFLFRHLGVSIGRAMNDFLAVLLQFHYSLYLPFQTV